MTRKACVNCEQYYVNDDVAICVIDKERIDVVIAEIKYCKAFKRWWGAVE